MFRPSSRMLCLLASAWMMALGVTGCVPAQKVPINFDWTFYNVKTGEAKHLSDFEGDVLVLNVFATWCGPCVEEMPSLQELYDTYHKQGVEFAVVSLSPGATEHADELKRIKEFARKHNLKFPMYVAFEEPPRGLQTESIPSTYFIDSQHRIQVWKVGGTNWMLPNWTKKLEMLIEETKVKVDPQPASE